MNTDAILSPEHELSLIRTVSNTIYLDDSRWDELTALIESSGGTHVAFLPTTHSSYLKLYLKPSTGNIIGLDVNFIRPTISIIPSRWIPIGEFIDLVENIHHLDEL